MGSMSKTANYDREFMPPHMHELVHRLIGTRLTLGMLGTSMAPFVYSGEAPMVARRLWEETMDELSFAGVKEIIESLA